MEGGGAGNAFDQQKAGHGNWNELMSSDPEAGFRFYSGLFGWQKSQAVDMGEMGTYQVFSHDGTDIGGMMGLGNSPVPAWLPYFGANGVDAAIGRIAAAGGKVAHGPTEVPAAPSSPSPRTRRAPGSPWSGRRRPCGRLNGPSATGACTGTRCRRRGSRAGPRAPGSARRARR